MELLIIKNGHVYARAKDEDTGGNTYSLAVVTDDAIPTYPTADAGKGKYYELDYIEGNLAWVTKDRPLTTEERLKQLAEDVESIKLEWKVGEAVAIGDRRYYKGVWYTCIQAHTTQADWTPDVVPALWKADK